MTLSQARLLPDNAPLIVHGVSRFGIRYDYPGTFAGLQGGYVLVQFPVGATCPAFLPKDVTRREEWKKERKAS